jgi:hypothetical protein
MIIIEKTLKKRTWIETFHKYLILTFAKLQTKYTDQKLENRFIVLTIYIYFV